MSSPENAPLLSEQMAVHGRLTDRIPQKYLIQNQSGLRVFYWAEVVSKSCCWTGNTALPCPTRTGNTALPCLTLSLPAAAACIGQSLRQHLCLCHSCPGSQVTVTPSWSLLGQVCMLV